MKRREEKYILKPILTKDLGCNGIPAVFSKESRNCHYVANQLKKKIFQKKFPEMKMQI